MKRGGKLEAVSWDEPLSLRAANYLAIKEKYGAKAIMTTGSSRGPGNEANPSLCRNLPRAVIGNNNIDCCARVRHDPSVAVCSVRSVMVL